MVKLTYFPVRGRAEISRLALEYAQVEYEDKRVTMEEWAELKPTFPFGQLPYFEDGDIAIPQSMSILRHIGRSYGVYLKDKMQTYFPLTFVPVGLYGSGNAEAARVDAIVDGTQDFHVSMMKVILSDKFVCFFFCGNVLSSDSRVWVSRRVAIAQS